MSTLLKKYIRLIVEASRGGKKLRVFDFDDTLVKTRSLIHVTSAAGESFDLTPGEYAVYESQPGDKFDYSDFSKLIDPKEIKWTVQILRNIVSRGGEVVILTARAHSAPIQQFLDEAGLPPIEVIALADSDPKKKSDYISRRIEEDGFDHVEFFDDSYKNVEAVKALRHVYPHVQIVPRHVVHKTQIN